MQENTASTEVFKARNGLHVRQAGNGGVEVGKPGYLDYTTPAATFALEEFFQAKRDAELGRWRSPLHPHYVVYLIGFDAVVVGEHVGLSQRFKRVLVSSESSKVPEAHPVRKPWQDASPGEVWVLTLPDEGDHDAEIVTVATTYGTFIADSLREWTLNDASIRSARPVSTEDAS